MTTHGHSRFYRLTPEYRSWVAMKTRCLNPNQRCYRWYGGRGIQVCQRWLDSFANFYADMGPKPTPKHTLDRIDGNGHYEPSNCRWATQREQTSHTSQSHLITYRGETLHLNEWARRLNLSRVLLRDRLRIGMSFEEAITTPITQKHLVTYQGETKTLTEWARHFGLAPHILKQRVTDRGWSLERAISTPIKGHSTLASFVATPQVRSE